MAHSDSAGVHHELTGSKANMLNENVMKLAAFIKERGNPFEIKAQVLKLHNIITKQMVDQEVKQRLLLVRKNADELMKKFRHERFIDKSKKLSFTISRRNLPAMNLKNPSLSTSTTSSTNEKETAAFSETLKY